MEAVATKSRLPSAAAVCAFVSLVLIILATSIAQGAIPVDEEPFECRGINYDKFTSAAPDIVTWLRTYIEKRKECKVCCKEANYTGWYIKTERIRNFCRCKGWLRQVDQVGV